MSTTETATNPRGRFHYCAGAFSDPEGRHGQTSGTVTGFAQSMTWEEADGRGSWDNAWSCDEGQWMPF